MKKITRIKAMIIALMMLLGVIAPVTATAQKSDGFFRGGNDNYQNRGDVNIPGNDENGISNYGIGETVPLGSGLLILTAVGAGYAISKRRRNKGFRGIKAIKAIIAFALCHCIASANGCKNQKTAAERHRFADAVV